MPESGGGQQRRSGVSARSAALVASLALATLFLAWTVNRHYPLRHWLFFVYLRLWLYTALFAVPCLAVGWRLTRWLVPRTPLLGERLVIAFALGTLTFAWGTFLCGVVGVLWRPFFFLWPAALLALGGRDTYRSWRHIWHRLSPLGMKLFVPRTALATAAAVVLGLGCLAMYLQIINPLNLGGDTHWYHLPIAERYAAAGRIRPFVEGWYLGAYPQLASLLYTWAFLAPGALFDHTQLASHVEWILVVGTVGGIGVLIRTVLGGRRAPFAAAALFLFPQIFAYDSNLITAADHVLAFWGPPLALLLLRLRDDFEPRRAVVAALVTAGAILTKYQGSYFAVVLFATLTVLAIRWRRPGPAIIAFLVCLAATSSHWLKNLLFYGDPVYPLLHRFLPSRPFHEGAAPLFEREYFNPLFTPTGSLPARLAEALKAMFTFSFVPHDFANFHGARPIFGPLFTLTVPVLFFVRAPRRLWWLVISTHLGVFVWFATSHEDRFLQALVPWMAAATAAVLVLGWQSLRWGRLAIVALVGLQLVDGADVYFLRSHGMSGDSPLRSTAAYLAAGPAGNYQDRFRIWGSGQDVAKELPKGAVVLLHRADHLGLGAVTITDDPGWQGGIDYLGLDTPASVAGYWQRLGVTHLTWYPDNPPGSLEDWAREAVFIRARGAVRTKITNVGRYRLTAAQAQAAAELTAPTRIAWLGCKGDPPTAIYSARGLGTRQPATPLSQEALTSDAARALEAAHVVIVRKTCKGPNAVDVELERSFEVATEGPELTAYFRR